MFGNRKRKTQEEESLVPHGLIWHATAEPTSAKPASEETAENEDSLGHTIQFAQLIEQTRRPQPAPEIVEPKPASQESSAAPAPLPWWRRQPRDPEPASPPIPKLAPFPLSEYGPTPVKANQQTPNVPQVQSSSARLPQIPAPQVHLSPVPPPRVAEIPVVPIAKAPVGQVPPTQVHGPLLPKREIRKYPASALPAKNNADAMSRSFIWLRALGSGAWRNILSAGGRVRRSWLRIFSSLEVREAVLRAAKQGQNLMQSGIARSGRFAQTAGRGVAAFSHAGMARLQRMSARISSAAATTNVLRPVNTQRPTPSRIRVLLAASALQVRFMAARRLSEWKTKRDRMAIDSRFWTSMTLSAITALIVLTIVSVVPRYAAKSLPSRILNTTSSVSASVDPPGVTAEPTVERTPVRKPAAPKITQEKTAQEKPSSTQAAAPPKPRRAADDDYVAPNTYKYYGSRSKGSR